MTTPAFVSAASVREYLGLNSVSSDSRYSDATIGSNIRAASWALERATGRIFRDETGSRTYSTNGAAFVVLPGLRTASAVTLQGATLVADESYWLVPDTQQTGVACGINLRPWGSGGREPWYLSNPEWFDRGLDMGHYGRNARSLPNDLVITGTWGYASPPEPLLHATKVLAGYYTKRPDAILSGALATPDGNLVNLSDLPVEVRLFVDEWRAGAWVAGL